MTKRHQEIDLYDDVEKIKQALNLTATDLRDKTSEAVLQSIDNVKEKTEQLHSDVADYTGAHPLKSLGVALLVGIGIGYLLHK